MKTYIIYETEEKIYKKKFENDEKAIDYAQSVQAVKVINDKNEIIY